jgi:hypothetical protein
LIEGLVEVVEGLLGWVDWGFKHLEVPVVVSDFLSSGETLEAGNDVVINSKVWDWVIDWVALWSLWPEVLVASSRGANWVRLGLNHSCSENVLGVCEIGLSHLDIMIEFWSEVVISILGWVVPLSLRLFGSHNNLVVEHGFSNADRVGCGLDIWVSSEACDWIIHWVAFELWVLELSATG